MKYFFYLIIAMLAVVTTSAKGDDILQFEEKNYDFGAIKDDHEPIVHEFKFVNTSTEPVAVLSVSTGCGCTRPEYPVKPIEPKAEGTIKITFLPKGQRGDINKNITVRYRGATAKSSKRITLRLRGNVSPK